VALFNLNIYYLSGSYLILECRLGTVLPGDDRMRRRDVSGDDVKLSTEMESDPDPRQRLLLYSGVLQAVGNVDFRRYETSEEYSNRRCPLSLELDKSILAVF